MNPTFDLDELLWRENAAVEWKEGGDPLSVVSTLAAFANNFDGFSDGGWVLCGIKEDQDAHGFPMACKVGLDSRTFKEISRSESRSQRFEAAAPLPKLIRDLLEKLRLYTGFEIDKTESALSHHQNRLRYSEKALQEALVNAFAHRDYESSEPTRITVFSDRIEIASPGGPLPGTDLERLRQGRSPVAWRNPALASFLLRMGLAQNEGQGIPTILSETYAVAGRNPEILPGSNSFVVNLPAYQPTWDEPIGKDGGFREGLVLVSIGGESIRSTVEHSLPRFDLERADVLVDFAFPGYVRPDAWEEEAVQIRNKVRRWVEDPRYGRIHLFYRGPVVLAPLLGALIAPAKPLIVYYYEDGRYERAYLLDRRFLRSQS